MWPTVTVWVLSASVHAGERSWSGRQSLCDLPDWVAVVELVGARREYPGKPAGDPRTLGVAYVEGVAVGPSPLVVRFITVGGCPWDDTGCTSGGLPVPLQGKRYLLALAEAGSAAGDGQGYFDVGRSPDPTLGAECHADPWGWELRLAGWIELDESWRPDEWTGIGDVWDVECSSWPDGFPWPRSEAEEALAELLVGQGR